MNRSFGHHIFIIHNEISLFPSIAKKAINVSLTQIVSTIQPIRAKNSHFDLNSSTLFVGIQSVKEGGAIVPFEVIEKLTELMLNDVEVATIGPIVPKINLLERSTVVHEQN